MTYSAVFDRLGVKSSLYFPSGAPRKFRFLPMDLDEIEAVLEKIWDLHDKLSDAIHSISRAHFLSSIKNLTRKSDEFYFQRKKKMTVGNPENKSEQGFVFVKEFRVDEDEPAVQEAKSLYDIRTALENLEDQLEFFHTVQIQQRAEKDSAMARLEQSRIILSMRLAGHHGKKYKVIEEAEALVSDVRDASHFVSPEHLYDSTPWKTCVPGKERRPNALLSFFVNSFNLISKSLKLDSTLGIMGNAALLAVSMLAFVHLNQLSSREKFMLDLSGTSGHRERRDNNSVLGSSSNDTSKYLDVMLARG